LKDAENMYSTSMDDWLKDTKPYASAKQLATKDQEMQEKTTIYFQSHFKGPDELTTLLIIQLQKVNELYN